jgi:hypothetical protein
MCGRIRTEGTSRKISVLVLLTVAAVLAIAGTALATPLEYTFSGNNQGWQQAQDQKGAFVSAGFQPSGGNPGGRLTARDSGAETGCPDEDPCQLLTFESPFVPALGANYGGIASFDLRSSAIPAFASELILLPTGPDYLDGLVQENLDTGYQHLSIQLNETANWVVCPYVGGECRRASQAQFIALIGATDKIAVMADVGPNGTGETYDLDNVVLTDGGPLPPGPPPHKKPKKCKKKKHKRSAESAKKKCKKKGSKKKGRAAGIALRG